MVMAHLRLDTKDPGSDQDAEPTALEESPLVTLRKIMSSRSSDRYNALSGRRERFDKEIIIMLTKIDQKDLDEKMTFDLIKFFLGNIEECFPPLDEPNCSDGTHTLNPTDQYQFWLLTFFHALQRFPSVFFNNNLDIISLILLKAYEFLSLKSTDLQTNQSQQEMENLLQSLMGKIAPENRPILEKEILSESLTFSDNHQYDEESLRHYLFKKI